MDKLFLQDLAKNYSHEIKPPFDNLLDKIGFNALYALIEDFGGSSIYIPNKKSLFRNCIAIQINKEFNGGNYRELALKYGLCERTIRNITNKKNLFGRKY